MRAQSTQNFFWILYTDPHVDADLQAVVVALRGTTAWAAQVVVSFGVSVAFSFHTLFTDLGDGDRTGDAGFAINGDAFALICTLSLAKAVRDRADADTL